jgi:peptide/nickel transport system substrate-binding protein
MTKYSNKLRYILIGLLILTSVNIIQLYPQKSNDPMGIIDDSEFEIETSDIVYVPFVVGVSSNPVAIDPVNFYDAHSRNVINQVCEGLFRYNLTDPDLSRVNWLAESYWWEDETTLRLKLRVGVLFHDNTAFNANAAKWNLDRINYLTNASGTLPDTMTPALPSALWKFPNGTGIMKQIDYINQYNITIHLNSPYSPFLDLLCGPGGHMISPSSHSQTDYIDLSTGDLVGTGPFEYDDYNPGMEVNFHAFDNYWRGKANITVMKYSIISDPTARNNAMLAGVIDYLYSPDQGFYSTFAADPNIVFAEAPTSGLNYFYTGMNNNKINVTWRKAISYAINYSHIIQDLRDNHVVRAHSPIAPSFGDGYYNCSDIAPYYNLTIARQTLIDDTKIDTTGLTANDNPDDAAWEAATLGTFNYTYYNSGFWLELYTASADWFDDIGINIIDVGLDYISYTNALTEPHKLNLFGWGWGPDYLDPFNMIDPLFSNSSEFNAASVNDPWLQTKLAEAIETTDDSARNTIYHNIQINFSSSLYPHAFLAHNRVYFVYNANLTNYPHNALGTLYFYPCEWPADYIVTPPTVIIDSPTDTEGFADTAPTFSLTLSPDYISIWYTLDGGITNRTCGTSGQIDSTLWNGLTDGPYTLRFYANNSYGLFDTAAISIYKDTLDPVITINDPDPGEEFTTEIPQYNITITEINLDSFWYSLDNGVTTIPISAYTGSINENAWNALPNGDVTITFYAVDDVGNLGSSSVIVTKNTPTIGPDIIPGPYVILILMVLFAGIIGLIWRQKQKLN